MAQGLLGGVLPAIYSGADQLKRGVYGLLTNPMQAIENTASGLIGSHLQRQDLMKQAFGDPTNPVRVTNQDALAQLGNDVLAGEMGFAPAGIFLPHTPLKPNPLVGTRYDREYMGGLADKTPVKIEDLKGSSIMLMPWDSTSRNVKIKGISDEQLARDVVTHGGQDYARDLMHIEQGIGGASNLGIAKRIRDRDAQARLENLEAGGSGNVIALPTTMGSGAENFSVMPTEIFFGLLDSRSPSKAMVKDIDKSIREFKIAKGIGDKRVITQPFKNFKGVMTEEGRMQLYTGEGIDSTAGELRKAFADRMGLKSNQEYFKYNLEDLTNAITDPALLGVPKGYVGNTVLRTGMEGMHLKPSQNPTYSTDFTSQYLGSLGQSVPAEVLMPKTFAKLSEQYKDKKADLRNMTLGGLEKKGQGFSEFVDDQVIENYYKYLDSQRKLGLLD
jgi:hypothetical protein